jgi:hypothetical protein
MMRTSGTSLYLICTLAAERFLLQSESPILPFLSRGQGLVLGQEARQESHEYLPSERDPM